MPDLINSFITNSTLLFIASRNAEGRLDVSPRGGQPKVLHRRADGVLMLPDYAGNRRLDTLGNVLTHPEVCLLLLARGRDAYLLIQAKARISTAPEELHLFPGDDNPPISVMLLTPSNFRLVETEALLRAGFWIGAGQRKPPMDLMGMLASDTDEHLEAGRIPVLRADSGEEQLVAQGLRQHYGSPSKVVSRKVFTVPARAGMGFLGAASLSVLAWRGTDGTISMAISGGETIGDSAEQDGKPLLRLPMPGKHQSDFAAGGQIPTAILAIEPGRAEAFRINGLARLSQDGAVLIDPEETFFHCSSALSRSRIWAGPGRIYWSGRRRFRCLARRNESASVVSFDLAPQDSAELGEILPGQYVTVSLPQDPVQPPRQRCYSVSGRSANGLRITVRRLGLGGVSDLFHDTLEPGGEVLLGVPGGRFVLDSLPGRRVALISAGVGMTPVLPMLRNMVESGDPREIWFLHATRGARDHILRGEVEELARRGGAGVHLFNAYSQPADGDGCDHAGRLDAALIASLFPAGDTDFYICGPDEFMAGLRAGLIGQGAAPEAVRMEEFVPRSGAVSGVVSGPARVRFLRSDRSFDWTAKDGTLLDLAVAKRVDVQFSCRMGDCQSCVQKIVSGKVSYASGEEPLLEFGQVLLCLAMPDGDVEIDC